jgi:hypothetical protein
MMTIRNPYDRLWSAFNDKFTSGNPRYLARYGRRIVKLCRKVYSKRSARCGDDITLTEFVKFIVYEQIAEMVSNPHWAPYYQLCDPCNIKYDLISSIENIKSDMDYFTEYLSAPKLKLQSSFNDVKEAAHRAPLLSYKNRPEHVFKQLDVNYCFTMTWFKHTFWKSLVYSGFVDAAEIDMVPNVPDVYGETYSNKRNWENIPMYLLNKSVENLFSKRTFEEGYALLKDRKSNLKQRALSTLSTDLLKNWLEFYWPDFSMFGYQMDSIT